MTHQQLFAIDLRTGVPQTSAVRLVRSFLDRHGTGLDDLLRRFPSVPGPTFRGAIKLIIGPGETARELEIALGEACDTMLSLREGDFLPLPIDANNRLHDDAGLRWYAARFRDLAHAAGRI